MLEKGEAESVVLELWRQSGEEHALALRVGESVGLGSECDGERICIGPQGMAVGGGALYRSLRREVMARRGYYLESKVGMVVGGNGNRLGLCLALLKTEAITGASFADQLWHSTLSPSPSSCTSFTTPDTLP